jgi:AcrR family transcriptional regulator
VGHPGQQRRRYDSSLRRQRAAQTRERIVAAGVQLAHECAAWHWHALTIRAVAERAEVSERTVYRHFPGERELHDAMMQRFEEEAGVTLEGLKLEDVADATARVFAHVSSYPLVPRTPLDATLTAADQRRRAALLSAIAASAVGWPQPDQRMAAAVLDVLWSLTSYERLVAAWELTPQQTTTAITWVMGLIQAATREGRGPGSRDAE